MPRPGSPPGHSRVPSDGASLTQSEVAERARLRQPDVSRLESGGATPTIGMLERLAYALELRFVARFEKLDAA